MDVPEAQQGASHLALRSADGQPGGLTQDCPVPPCAPCKEGRFAGGSQSLRHCVLNSETESQSLRYVPLWPGSPWSSSGPQFPNFPPAASLSLTHKTALNGGVWVTWGLSRRPVLCSPVTCSVPCFGGLKVNRSKEGKDHTVSHRGGVPHSLYGQHEPHSFPACLLPNG